MIKTFENLLRNQMANDLQTQYASLGIQALPRLLKWWPLVDLDLFYSKVKFGHLGFVWENNNKTVDLYEAIITYDIQSWYIHSPKWTFITTKGQGHLLTFVLFASDSVFLSSPLKLWAETNQITCGAPVGCRNEKLFMDFSQMIKIFAMPIYGKNPLKIFFWGFERLKTLNLGMQHWELWPY